MSRIFSSQVIAYVLLLWVLDLSLMEIFAIGQVQPVLLYLMVLYITFYWGWQQAVPIAVMAGLLRDLVSYQPLGVETSALVISSVALDFLVQKLERGILILRVVIAFLFISLTLFINQLFSVFLVESVHITWYQWSVLFGTAAYTAVLLPLFSFVSVRWFRDRVTVRQYELFK